jgi:hypothetical protein
MRLTLEIVEGLAREAENNGYAHVRRIGPVIRVCGAAIVQADWGAAEKFYSRKVKIAGGYLRIGFEHPEKCPRRAGGIEFYFMLGQVRGETILRVQTVSEAHSFAAEVAGNPRFLHDILLRHPSRPRGEELAWQAPIPSTQLATEFRPG